MILFWYTINYIAVNISPTVVLQYQYIYMGLCPGFPTIEAW